MANLVITYWRDIPSAISVKAGRKEEKRMLADRFQEAIDMAATRIGLIGTDEYLNEWRRVTRECGDDLDAEASKEAHALEQAYGDSRLESLVRSGGTDEGEAT